MSSVLSANGAGKEIEMLSVDLNSDLGEGFGTYSCGDDDAMLSIVTSANVACGLHAGDPEIIMIATGSELSLAVDAHEKLVADGIRSRVVSMPSWDIFEHQTQEYRDSVLPSLISARVAIEQASTFGWERYVGTTGRVIGMHTFGASAPLKALQQEFGFTVENVVATVRSVLQRKAA